MHDSLRRNRSVRAILPIILALGFGAAAAREAPAAGAPDRDLRYDIRVELDADAKMLRGREEIVWRNTTLDEVPDMLLHLYWNAFKNEASAYFREASGAFGRPRLPERGDWGWVEVTGIRLAGGEDLRPTFEYVHPDEPVHPDDQTVARIRFPEPVPPGGEVRLEIDFQAKIPRTVARSGHYRDSYFIAQWFPKPGVYEEGKGWNAHAYHFNSEFFAAFADFVVRIRVPERFVVGASGKRVDRAADAATGTVTYTYAQDGIHDFAWTADPDYLEIERTFSGDREVTPEEYAEVARKLGVSVEDVRLPDVKMTLLIAPEHEGQIERHFAALRAALKLYGLWYGPYPYETVTMVDPPFRTGAGGMEYPTLFTAGTDVLTHPDIHSLEMVIVHEFGHGYWYGLVANNEFEEAWLDEGINTYSTGRVMARAYGPGALPAWFKGIPLAALFPMPKFDDFATDRAAALQVVETDPVVTESWRFHDRMSYAANVYMRAATLLNTLERYLGEETMMRVMRTFHSRWRFRHPTTGDFIDAAAEISGRELGWFFEQLFHDTLQFDYGVGSIVSVEAPGPPIGVFDVDGGKEERTRDTVREGGAGKRGETSFVTTLTLRRFGEARLGGDAALPFRVTFEDGSTEEGSWDGRARWARFTFIKPSRARSAQVDPEGIWLIDANLANNSRTLRPVRGGPIRMAAKLFFFFQNVLLSLGGLG